MNTHRTERGQALVLLVLAFVGLLGFTALTIDGGLVFWTRRRAQNAADTASLSAALAKIQHADWHAAAMGQAASYGFQNDAKSEVIAVSPPVTGVYVPPFPHNDRYVQVVITTTLDTAFAHFVYSGPLKTTVEAVARMQPAQNIFPGNALHATNETACQAVWFAGSQDVEIEGGNVFSNSDASGSPTSCHSGVKSGSSGHIIVQDGGINVVGTFRNQTGVDIYADDGINTGVEHQELSPVPVPDCSGMDTHTYSGGSTTLHPGQYPHGLRVTSSNTDIVLDPGMYCFGDDVTMNGGSIHGEGVMIYMEHGDFTLSGNTFVYLRTSTNLLDSAGQQWAGMLLYVDPANTGLVKISGTSDSSYTGTIYAPSPAQPSSQHKCTITGNGENIGLNSQVICNTVKIDGDSHLFIRYREEENYHLPPTVELVQ
jgi:hypothetical protein